MDTEKLSHEVIELIDALRMGAMPEQSIQRSVQRFLINVIEASRIEIKLEEGLR